MKKITASILLLLVMLAMTTGIASAQETTLITGTVQTVVIESNETTGETVVVVTLLDEAGTSQTLQINLETAKALELVVTDPATGETKTSEGAVGATVEIDPATVIPEETAEEEQHPVGSALSDFFSDLTGISYETVMSYHDDGMGFGVIAQALWLSNGMGGGEEMFTALLDAKQSGDFSGITLADGSTPDNWGDVVTSLKKGESLGSVKSGKAVNAENEEVEQAGIEKEHGKSDKKSAEDLEGDENVTQLSNGGGNENSQSNAGVNGTGNNGNNNGNNNGHNNENNKNDKGGEKKDKSGKKD